MSTKNERPSMKKPLRVLVLEDQPADAESELHELRQAGFHLTSQVVASETDFCAQLAHPWDIILCDYSMPQFDARRALEILKERALDIPLIVVSGTIGEDVAVATMKQGAADYLMKDRLMRLGLSITQALEHKRLRLEHKGAMDLLLERERHFRALIENGADGIGLIDFAGNILYVSPSTRHLLGYSEEELQQRSIFALVHKDDLERMKALLVKLTQGDAESVTWETQLRHADNSWRWFEGTGTVFHVNPDERQFVLNYRDITQRKGAEEALRQSEEKYRRFVQNMAEGLTITDGNENFIFANPAADKIFGVPEGALIGRNLDEFLEPAKREFIRHQTEERR